MDIGQIVERIRFPLTVGATSNCGLWYLATPYSKYPFGRKQAYIDASAVAGALLKRGVPIFCPIAHTRPLVVYGDVPDDYDIMLLLDEHMMKACAGVIVVQLAGWKDSYGVNYEIEWFRKAVKPVLFLDPSEGVLPPLGKRFEKAAEGVEKAIKEAEQNIGATPLQGGKPAGLGTDPDFHAKLPTDRKNHPLARGVLDYFPDALMEVAAISKAGNDKHNPGEELHHARGKSTGHADCILRHLKDRGTIDPEDGRPHSGKVAWRALALLQEELEQQYGLPTARGANPPATCADTAAQQHVEMNGKDVAVDDWYFGEKDRLRPELNDYPTGPAHPYFPFGG